MPKLITKVAVRCPHCGGEQQEPELAKSTFCRSCSQYFAITPASLASNPPAVSKAGALPSVTEPGSRQPVRSERNPGAGSGGGLIQKFEGLFGKPKVRTAHCFECASSQEVSGNSHSTTCRACGAYIDLQDYKINGSFSRNIKTRGSIYLGPKGALSSSKIACTDAVIHGKMRGSMRCEGKATIKYQGRLQGSLETGSLVVEKGSDVVFSRPVKAGSVTIAGRMVGQIHSSSHIMIHKTGALEGAAIATGFNVEKGGCFEGELTISPPGTLTLDAQETRAAKFDDRRPSVSPVELGAFLTGEANSAPG